MWIDNKDDSVKEAVVCTLGLLIAFITDADKYSQVVNLIFMSCFYCKAGWAVRYRTKQICIFIIIINKHYYLS
jgi:hypothetical protein